MDALMDDGKKKVKQRQRVVVRGVWGLRERGTHERTLLGIPPSDMFTGWVFFFILFLLTVNEDSGYE